MPLPILPFALFGGAIAGIGTLTYFFERSAHARLLEELRTGVTRSVGSLTSGELARVVGKAELVHRTLTAPLSGRTCFAWQVSVWQPITSRAWTKILDRQEQVPFAVLDGTGRAVIETDRVRSYAAVDHEERVADVGELDRAARAFFEQQAFRPTGRTVLHLKESVLEPAERAVVVGFVRRTDDDGSRSTYRQPAELSEIRLVPPRRGSVLFSDAPEAIDPVDEAG
jgi:hypothetical protein